MFCAQVQTVTITGIHAEQVHSISYFLALDYGPSAHRGLPTRLFLKLPRPGIDLTVAAAIGEREVGIIARLLPISTLCPLFSVIAQHTHLQRKPIISCLMTCPQRMTNQRGILKSRSSI